jgi:hypothetical protein
MYYLLKVGKNGINICSNFRDSKLKKRYLQRELDANKKLINTLGLDNSLPKLINSIDDVIEDGIYCQQTSNINIYSIFSYKKSRDGYIFNSVPIFNQLYEYRFIFYKENNEDNIYNETIKKIKKENVSEPIDIKKNQIDKLPKPIAKLPKPIYTQPVIIYKDDIKKVVPKPLKFTQYSTY